MKYLVIGTGSIGKRHIRNLLATGVDKANIAAVDTREDRRAEVQAMGVVETFPTFEAALDKQTYVAAFICSPTSLHIAQGIELAKRGIHMLMEKPLARDLQGVEELSRQVAANKVVLLMAYIFRFSPLITKVKELLDAESIGKVLYCRGEFSEYLPDWHPYEDYRSFYMARKSEGGGSILDQSHIMDLVHYLLGGFHSVFAYTSNLSTLELQADDYAEMTVRLKSGALASIHTDIFGRDHKKQLEIKGENGNLYWDHYLNQVHHYDARTKMTVVYKKFPTDFNLNYLEQTRHFLACCAGKESPRATLQEGIETMDLILAAERSQENGGVERIID